MHYSSFSLKAMHSPTENPAQALQIEHTNPVAPPILINAVGYEACADFFAQTLIPTGRCVRHALVTKILW